MRLKKIDYLELPASADMHVHLRQGAMMDLVAPQIRSGGADTAFVMVRNIGSYLHACSQNAAQPNDALGTHHHHCGGLRVPISLTNY